MSYLPPSPLFLSIRCDCLAWYSACCSYFMFYIIFLLSWQFAFHSFFQLLMADLYNNLRTLYQSFFMHYSPHVQSELQRNNLSQLIDSGRCESEVIWEKTLLYRIEPVPSLTACMMAISKQFLCIGQLHPYCNG